MWDKSLKHFNFIKVASIKTILTKKFEAQNFLLRNVQVKQLKAFALY